MTEEQYTVIVNKLEEILTKLKPAVVVQGGAQSGMFHVNIEEPGKGTKNGKWMLFRGKFQQDGARYPDWVSLFVRIENSGGIRKGDCIAVEGRLSKEIGNNGKPLFSIFADKVIAQPSQTVEEEEPLDDIPF